MNDDKKNDKEIKSLVLSDGKTNLTNISSGIGSLNISSKDNLLNVSMPNEPLIIKTPGLQEDIQERWEFYDSEDFNSLRNSVKAMLKSYGDNENDPSDKIIRKISEELNVYRVTLKKFIKGEDLSKLVARKLFTKLVNKFDTVVIDENDKVKNHISLMKQISNKKIDAITIEYLYPESEKLGNYHTQIIKAYSLIEKTWNEFWKNYPIKKIEQIERYAKCEEELEEKMSNLFKDWELDLYFKVLPPFMHNRLPSEFKSDENTKIGLFFIYAGFKDNVPELDNNDNPISKELRFHTSPDLNDVISKPKSID